MCAAREAMPAGISLAALDFGPTEQTGLSQAAARFDLHHLGAQVREQTRAERAGDDMAEIQHPDAGQRQRGTHRLTLPSASTVTP